MTSTDPRYLPPPPFGEPVTLVVQRPTFGDVEYLGYARQSQQRLIGVRTRGRMTEQHIDLDTWLAKASDIFAIILTRPIWSSQHISFIANTILVFSLIDLRPAVSGNSFKWKPLPSSVNHRILSLVSDIFDLESIRFRSVFRHKGEVVHSQRIFERLCSVRLPIIQVRSLFY